ncbi:ABC transporter A family member 9-like protein, partial [Tanacetum coccineum]
AMLVHPDKNMGSALASESFKKIQCAYEVLCNSIKKRDYDEQPRKKESNSLSHKSHSTFDQDPAYYSVESSEYNAQNVAIHIYGHTKLLRHVGIVAPGSTFDDALCMFNTLMEIDFLSNPSEIDAPKLMKKMADIYFTRVTKDAESSFSLSPRQMALWQSQKEDHTSDWLRVVPISGLGQTMNGRDKALRPADILLYSWDGGLDVCVDLTRSSPLMQTGMAGFVPGRAATEAAQRKHVKYEAKCADIGYGFLPFSFSSFGELEKDAMTLLKRIRKFSMTQDIGARCHAPPDFTRRSWKLMEGVRSCRKGMKVMEALRSSRSLLEECRIVHSS